MSAEPRRVEIPQEDDRVPGRRIAVIVVASLAVMTMSIGFAGWMLHSKGRGRVAPASSLSPRGIDAIDRTLIGHDAYGESMRRTQQRVLARYGWIDRNAGIARIPIERAMDLVVEQERAR